MFDKIIDAFYNVVYGGSAKKAISALNSLWNDFPAPQTTEIAAKTLKVKRKLDRYFDSEVNAKTKLTVANESRTQLSNLLAPYKRSGTPVPTNSVKNFLLFVESSIDSENLDMGLFGKIIHGITMGRFDALLNTEETKNGILDKIAFCFTEFSNNNISDEKRAVIVKKLGNLYNELRVAKSIHTIENLLNEIVLLSDEIEPAPTFVVSNQKPGSVKNFLANCDDVIESYKMDSYRAQMLHNALISESRELAAKANAALAQNRTSDYSDHIRSINTNLNLQSGCELKTQAAAHNIDCLVKIKTRLEVAFGANLNLDEISYLLESMTYGEIVNQYEYVLQLIPTLTINDNLSENMAKIEALLREVDTSRVNDMFNEEAATARNITETTT